MLSNEAGERLKAELPEQRPDLRALLDRDGALRTLPFRDDLEAFYAVSLQRDTAGTVPGIC